MQPEDLERNFGFLLHDCSRLLRMVYDRRVRSLGLTRSQWWVLTHLYRNQGATQSELAGFMEIEKASLGRMLDRLEASGWVRREPDQSDRRVRRVYLTEAIEPSVRELRKIAAEVRREALVGLSDEELDKFVDLLSLMKDNLMQLASIDDAGEESGSAQAKPKNTQWDGKDPDTRTSPHNARSNPADEQPVA